jgi:hypothetical protein
MTEYPMEFGIVTVHVNNYRGVPKYLSRLSLLAIAATLMTDEMETLERRSD